MSTQKHSDKPVSEAEKLLAQYRSRLATEGWIKSALCGLIVGFALDILYTVLSLVFGIKMYWIGPVAFVVGVAAATPLFYFGKFKNSLRQVASRVDMLGLEERVLTMAQLEGDESFMARRQREDTIAALKKVNASLIKLAVSVPLIVVCATTAVVSATATTADALVDESLLQYISDSKTESETVYYEIVYGVMDNEGGIIVGGPEQKEEDRKLGIVRQKVAAGSTGEPMQAIADDGYIFVGWTDGVEDAFRADADVQNGFKVMAIFEPADANDFEDGDPSQDPSQDQDSNGSGDKRPWDEGKAPAKPGDPSDDGDGDGDGEGDGDGDGAGAGGSSLPGNQVIDGKTFYGNEYGNSLSEAQNATSGNTDLSGGQSDTISDYFNNIAK